MAGRGMRQGRVSGVSFWILAALASLAGCATMHETEYPAAARVENALPPQATGASRVVPTQAAPQPALQAPPTGDARLQLVADPLVTPAPPIPAATGMQSASPATVRMARVERPIDPQPVARTVLHVNAINFAGQVLHSDVPVLVDFYASWCGPCRALAPTLGELAAETPQVKVVKIDVDENQELAERYGVQSLPCLLVFQHGRVVARQVGLTSKARLRGMLGL